MSFQEEIRALLQKHNPFDERIFGNDAWSAALAGFDDSSEWLPQHFRAWLPADAHLGATRLRTCARQSSDRRPISFTQFQSYLLIAPVVTCDLDPRRTMNDNKHVQIWFGGVLVSTWETRQRRHAEDGSLAS